MKGTLRSTIQLKNKGFLKNFIILLSVFLCFGIMIALWGYQTSVKALEQEVNQMNYSTALEVCNRMEESLEQGNRLASLLAIDERVQLFFTHRDPEKLIDSYYSEVKGKLAVHGIPYIDSILLYSPKYQRIYDSKEKVVLELPDASGDLSWIDEVESVDRTTTKGYIRANDNGWPYYYTLMKHYRYGTVDGVVVVNIDLQKLYEYLLADRGESLELYVIDQEQRIVMKRDQMELFGDPDEVAELRVYEPELSFADLHVTGEERYAYAQVHSDKYGFTAVTVTQVGEYLVELVKVQRRFMLVLFMVAMAAMAVACSYSIKLLRPIQSIKNLLDNPKRWERDKHTADIQEVADQIISHLQTNTLLRQELDSRLNMLNQTQLQALQSQINPHFLFNTLNIVNLMLEQKVGEEDPTIRIVEELSDILRYSLSADGMASIKEEVENAKKYLSIMQFRYEGFKSVINVEESLYDCAIPRLVLQPLIENAVQHGLVASIQGREGVVAVNMKEILCAYDDQKELPSVCLEISDNGIGMGEEQLEELRRKMQDNENIPTKHIGVSNVARRFYLYFHNEQQITLESTLGKGTRIRIVFPLIEFVPKQKI